VISEPFFTGHLTRRGVEGCRDGGDISAQMILAEWLFVETVSDLERRRRNRAPHSRYELLYIALLLRKLHIDKIPLLNAAKGDHLNGPLLFRVYYRLPTRDLT